MTPVQQRFEKFKRATALVIGDVMLDAYLWGKVERISPEAPVPVVHVKERSARLGGAANVALNMRALGARPVVISMLGADEHAEQLVQRFTEKDLDHSGLLRSAMRRTTVKTRVISGHQHIVRVDEETDAALSETDAEAVLGIVRAKIESERPDVIVFEDYDKGALTPFLISAVVELAKEKGIPTTVDPKRRNFLSYQHVDLFKPNLKELEEGTNSAVNAADRTEVRKAVARLEDLVNNRITLLTLSELGCYIHSGNEDLFLPAHRRSIADVSGAGDTVIAMASLLLAQGADLSTIAAWSNLAGGSVCEEVGVVPVDADRFRTECEALGL